MENSNNIKNQIKKEILDAYIFLREKNHSIPSETLDFIKNAALEKLECEGNNQSESTEQQLQQPSVSNSACKLNRKYNNCKIAKNWNYKTCNDCGHYC